MASSRVLAAIIRKTKDAIENFVQVPGVIQSIQKQIAKVAATEAGIDHSEIRNVTYEGMKGVCFDIIYNELKETHVLVQNSAFFEYYIVTKPNDVSKKTDQQRIFSVQMPQITPAQGGDGAN